MCDRIDRQTRTSSNTLDAFKSICMERKAVSSLSVAPILVKWAWCGSVGRRTTRERKKEKERKTEKDEAQDTSTSFYNTHTHSQTQSKALFLSFSLSFSQAKPAKGAHFLALFARSSLLRNEVSE